MAMPPVPRRVRWGRTSRKLGGFTSVGEQQADVFRCHHSEVVVQGIGGVEEQRHQPDGGEGGSDLAGHDPALAHTGDHQLGFAISATFQQGQGCLHLIAAQPFRSCGNGGGFLLQTAGESGQRRNPR